MRVQPYTTITSYIPPSACGICERGHDARGRAEDGHPYEVPTDPQMKARLMMKIAVEKRRPIGAAEVETWVKALADDPGPGGNRVFGELCEWYAAGNLPRTVAGA